MLGGNLLVALLAFATGAIIARTLGPQGKGLIAAMLVVPTLVVGLSNLGIRQATIHHVGQGTFPLQTVVGTLLTLLIGVSVGGVGIGAAILFSAKSQAITLELTLLTLALIPPALAINYCGGVFLARQDVPLFVKLRWLPALVRFAGVLLLLLLLDLGVLGVLLAWLAAQLLIIVVALRRLSEVAPLRLGWDLALVKSLLRLGVAYAAALYILQLNLRLDVLLLERLSTMEEIGIYSVGVTLAEQLWQLPAAFGLVVFARSAAARDEAELSRSVARIMRVTILLAALGAGALFFAAAYLIPWIYGESFKPSVDVLRLILPGVTIFTIFKVLNSDLSGRGRPGVALMVFGPAVGLNVALNVALIPTYGARGAAVASTLSYATATLVFVAVYARVTGVPLRELVLFQRGDLGALAAILRRGLSRLSLQ